MSKCTFERIKSGLKEAIAYTNGNKVGSKTHKIAIKKRRKLPENRVARAFALVDIIAQEELADLNKLIEERKRKNRHHESTLGVSKLSNHPKKKSRGWRARKKVSRMQSKLVPHPMS